MLKLNAGFARKIGEANFGSRGASVNVELELDSNLIGDPDAFGDRIRNLFDLARQAVDEELATTDAALVPSTAFAGNGRRHAPGGHNGSDSRDDPAARNATASQLRAIRTICQRHLIDADRVANAHFHVEQIEELTIQEASRLIDELNATTSNGRPQGSPKGGAR